MIPFSLFGVFLSIVTIVNAQPSAPMILSDGQTLNIPSNLTVHGIDLISTITMLQANLAAVQNETTSLKTDFVELQILNVAYQSQINTLKVTVSQVQSTVAQLQQSITAFTNELSSAQAQILALQQQLAASNQSTFTQLAKLQRPPLAVSLFGNPISAINTTGNAPIILPQPSSSNDVYSMYNVTSGQILIIESGFYCVSSQISVGFNGPTTTYAVNNIANFELVLYRNNVLSRRTGDASNIPGDERSLYLNACLQLNQDDYLDLRLSASGSPANNGMQFFFPVYADYTYWSVSLIH